MPEVNPGMSLAMSNSISSLLFATLPLPDLARAADHRSLGNASPYRCRGHRKAKRRCCLEGEIKRRLELFWSLPFDKLDALRLEKATKEIGQKS